MRKLGLVVAIYIVVGTLCTCMTILPECVRAPTIFVGGAGPGNYTTIQEGIDHAGANTTVFVYSGTYNEHITISKPISLVGEHPDTTIIDGGGTDVVVSINASWVEIKRFTVRGSGNGQFAAGIYLGKVSACSIHDNIITGNEGDGVFFWYSSGNTIFHNNISSNNWSGITDDWLGGGNTMTDNMMLDNGVGIYIPISGGDIVSRNVISGSYYGIVVYDTGHNTIFNNTISNNDVGISLEWANDNLVYHNRFLNNTVQAQDDGSSNDWDNGYPAGGNHWSEYIRADLYEGPGQDIPGSDGIGDVPYAIDGDSKDRYPIVPHGVFYVGPPENTRAVLEGTDFENVMVKWDPPPHEHGGLVANYDIYRGHEYDDEGRLYKHIGSIPSGTHSLTDTLAGEGDSGTYFYVVCARCIYKTSTCANTQAAKFTRPLTPGPNLVSIPLMQSDESIETVLQTVQYDKAWYYDSSSGEWKWYMTSKGYGRGLWNVNHTMGLWLNVTEDSNLTVAGVVPPQTTIHLHEGWNLVSFPSMNASFTVSHLKTSVPVVRVEGFDPAPPYFLRVLSDSDALLAGRAYWVKVQADVVWTVPFV
ncbi:MAG: right-handed parallel beta-helix repeat-containing protein [Thermoplasmata archaeon]|nr:right-handed parallel beta-helix repeat-containing protein [Thermoplasmata archaeon]